jgi:ABC-type branched-subunit amino acid transport system ATPase component
MKVVDNLQMGAYHPGSAEKSHRFAGAGVQLFPILKERKKQKAGLMSGENNRCWRLPGIDVVAETAHAR